jgi:toxin YoeB
MVPRAGGRGRRGEHNVLSRTHGAKVNTLIEECRRDPFKGTGKPEPLGGNLSGWWSRRISHEHRLVYRVAGSGEEQVLQVAQCRYHY